MLGPPVNPTDVYSEPINIGDVIVYGVGRGSIDFGIVADIIHKPEKYWHYDPASQFRDQRERWASSLKVEKRAEKWKTARFVRLQGTGHVFVITGQRADDIRKDIVDSWNVVDDTI